MSEEIKNILEKAREASRLVNFYRPKKSIKWFAV